MESVTGDILQAEEVLARGVVLTIDRDSAIQRAWFVADTPLSPYDAFTLVTLAGRRIEFRVYWRDWQAGGKTSAC